MAEDGTKKKDLFVSVDVGGDQYDYAKPQSNLEFISGSYSESTSPNAGSMKFTTAPGYSADEHFIRHRGATASFLESKGFGWLLDSEIEDEDSKKPLLEELDIDLRDIYYKLRCVLLPLPQLGFNRQLVRDSPDFWGPLVVVLVYALVSLYGQFSVVSWILTMWICGSCLIFVLARLLGGEVTFGQCLGVIGYSLLPLVIIGVLIPLVGQFYLASFCLQVVGVLWSTASAGSLLCGNELQSKRSLLLYPVFLLYIYFLSLYTGV